MADSSYLIHKYHDEHTQKKWTSKAPQTLLKSINISTDLQLSHMGKWDGSEVDTHLQFFFILPQ